ncbi:MAG: YhdP family protein, partial [Gammaproteobacteria bacterium]|nr:YhdP family protein [Gammaproteobacteria bacterium]
MKLPSKFIRNCFHTLTYLAVSLLVLAAIFLSIARLMLPAIEEYKPDIELWISDMIGQQIEIATLDAAWYGLEPQLVLKGVQLLSDDRRETFGYFQQARIGLNIIGSIYEGRFKPGGLTIEGAHLFIVRQENGNVTISGLKNQSDKKAVSKNETISDWLFRQRILDVKDSEVIWLDLKSGQAQWNFSQVNLKFINDGDHHLINGAVTLPKALGARLEVAVDARGDLLSSSGWSGNAYIEGANLRLSKWLEKVPGFEVPITDGMIGLRVWSQWRKAELSSVKGEVFSNGFKISVNNAPKMQVIESLSSNILIQKMNNAWEATFDEIVISTAKKVWPQARVDFRFDPTKDEIKANVSYLDLNDVLPVVKLFEKTDKPENSLISRLKPSGAVKNIALSMNDIRNSPRFYVQGEFSQLSSLPWKQIPGVKKLGGQFSLSNEVLKLKIPRQDFLLNYSGVFSYPANLKNVEGLIFLKNDQSGFSVVAQDIKAEFKGAKTNGSLFFEAPKNENPKLDLAFYFSNGLVSNAKYYIPSRVMSPGAVDWIGHSLLDGKVKSGGLLYYGNLRQFPFYGNEGLFDLTLEIENGKLLFAKDWPEIERIDGEFNLFANALSFHADTATSLGSELNNVDVDFPDFRAEDKKLLITGGINGKSEDKINYLHNSPLESIFAKNISPLKLKGKSQLELSLDIPLSDTRKTRVNGSIAIKNNHLLADAWKLDIDNVSTELFFDNRGIMAKSFTGVMNEIRLNGDIESVDQDATSAHRNIVIRANANADKEDLTYLLANFVDKAHWGNYISGKTNLNTEIRIPILVSEDKPEKISLDLQADLENVGFSLPYPLEKTVGVKDKLDLFVELSGDKRQLNIKTEKLNALLEIVPAGNTQLVTRGGIGFGKTAELPSENGYRFLGHLDRFSWTQWEPVIFPEEDEIPLLAGGGGGGSQYFDVELDKLEIFGSWFGKTSVQASSGAQLWSIHLAGDELAGEIFIPVVLSSAPLVMNMEKLFVVRGESNEKDEEVYLDPRLMPEVKVTAKSFVYNNKNFGELTVVANKIGTGLHLDQLSMKTKDTKISATGDWIEVDGLQTSKFDILVNTSHLGKTVKSWGFADAFGGGKGNVRINANWEGKPSDFSFEVATGKLDINISDASL